MTRCERFWNAISGIMEIKDKEERKKAFDDFCEKHRTTVGRIADHYSYCVDVEKRTGVPIGTKLPEGATRPLRTLKRKDPDMEACALDLMLLDEDLKPTEAIRQAKATRVKPVNIPKNCVNDSIENILEYLEPETVDMILTDPPYPEEYLPLWSVLAEKAAVLLKPGGFLVAYSGQFHLTKIFNMLEEYLSYVWTFALTMPGVQNRVMARNIWNGWKPILVFAKSPYEMEWQTDILESPARVKTEHEWQQNIGPVKELVKNFTLEKQLVVDPFLGSGTTMRACEELNRQFFGMDTDEGVFRNG